MRTFACVFAIALLIVAGHTAADARVIAGDLENGVAVYYFNSFTNSGQVRDYSGNGLHGSLYDGAQLNSGCSCLSLGTDAANFDAWYDKSLSVLKEFSIVAWVYIPQQVNDFPIEISAYNLPSVGVSLELKGAVELRIQPDGNLLGTYFYDGTTDGTDHSIAFNDVQSTDKNINNNQWQHIGFVVNSTSMKLYLNGTHIVNQTISGHESFAGTESIVSIGWNARGSVDDVGLFKNDLTDAQIKLIYDQGLATIISIASVDPSGKIATTWGALKQN